MMTDTETNKNNSQTSLTISDIRAKGGNLTAQFFSGIDETSCSRFNCGMESARKTKALNRVIGQLGRVD